MQFDIDLSNEKKPSINILGACFLRDAFGLGKVFGDYEIKTFIQSNSVFSMTQKPLSLVIDEKHRPKKEDFSKAGGCWFEWFSLDYDKTVFEKLRENKSDWLIFGLSESAYMLHKIEQGGGNSIVF